MNEFPVPGDRVVCGLRFSLPKADRAHVWVLLGVDTRHYGDFGEFVDMAVFACSECGRDKMKRLRVPRVAVDESALRDLLRLADPDDFDSFVSALNIKRISG